MTPKPELPIPERYQVLETVSHDEGEVVYRCLDQTLGREVFFKQPGIALRAQSSEAELNDRTLREARALAQVDHPGVQRLLEVIESSEGVMLVLEPVVGECLAERLECEGPLAPADVAKLGVEMADALNAVHAIGTVHRDVSAQTIHLRPDGSACLSGFRFAKFTSQARPLSTIAEVLRTKGPDASEAAALLPAHPAPEQFGSELASARTDLFALGCVLYSALTGKQPFPDMLGHGWSPPKSPEKIVSGVPQPLSKAIMSCLARSPVGRVQSAAKLAESLRAAGGSGGSPGTTTGARKSRSAQVAGLAVVALLAVAFVPRWLESSAAESEAGERGISVIEGPETGISLAGSVFEPTISKSYALLIGIGEAYRKNGFTPLANASSDVAAVAEMLEALPRPWEVELLTDDQATRDGIMRAKQVLEDKLEPDDRALIFYAGHGTAHADSEESGWIVPADGQTQADDPSRLKWIRYDEFKRFFDEAPAKHIMILMDCCYSGRFAKERSSGAVPFEQRYLSRKAHVVLTSGRGNETVLDGAQGERSPFAAAFMNAIQNCEEPAITSSMIYSQILKEFTQRGIPHEAEQYHPDPAERGQFVFFLE